MSKTIVLDNTLFEGKPGATGLPGQGCIPGATFCQMWQPNDSVNGGHIGTGYTMLNVEQGKQGFDITTKEGMKAGKQVIADLSAKAASVFPASPQYWYGAPAVKTARVSALAGDKNALAKCKEWESQTADLIALGYPGKTVKGVFIDCYDYSYLSHSWLDTCQYNAAPWRKAGISVIWTLHLRMIDTGAIWTPAMTRERLRIASENSYGGFVCIHDGYDATTNIKEPYSGWVLKDTIESIATARIV